MNKPIKYTEEYLKLVIKNGFTSNNTGIDNFLKSTDALDNSIGVTYIMLDDEETNVIGYFNISASRVDESYEVQGDKYLRSLGGAIKINYLALDEKYQHQLIQKLSDGSRIYLGDYLLHQCEDIIRQVNNQIGISFIYLSSTAEGYKLYTRNDYTEFEEDMSIVKSDKDTGLTNLYKNMLALYYDE